MTVQVGRERVLMTSGDSLYFNSADEHEIIPVSKTVKYLNIFA